MLPSNSALSVFHGRHFPFFPSGSRGVRSSAVRSFIWWGTGPGNDFRIGLGRVSLTRDASIQDGVRRWGQFLVLIHGEGVNSEGVKGSVKGSVLDIDT